MCSEHGQVAGGKWAVLQHHKRETPTVGTKLSITSLSCFSAGKASRSRTDALGQDLGADESKLGGAT
jgi:hypothetical protein